MGTFFETLEKRARQADSLLCIGLDPHPQDLSENTARAALDFCLRLIEATSDVAAAYKPNAAFFEVFGPAGIEALQLVIAAVPEGIPAILDAKRGDIASTAEAYARAAFDTLGAGAVTINPYLGRDALEPFLRKSERGAFLLCRTSNPGAADVQDLPVRLPEQGGKGAREMRLYEAIAHLARQWNQNDNLGLVAGATYPAELARVRLLAGDLWILAPGVGAQGGDLHQALQAGLRQDGLGMLIPVSRAISRAGDARQAAMEMRENINKGREKALNSRQFAAAGAQPMVHDEQGSGQLADTLLETGCVKFGQFTLKSGLQSPIYLDLRRLVTYPQVLADVAHAYAPILQGIKFDRLAGIPYAALPIATAISLQGGWPLIYPRKEAKAYGTKAEIEGVWQAGDRVVVIDDLATTGESKFEAIEKLASAGLTVEDVVVLIDRQSGAAEALAQAGIRLHAVLTLAEMLDHWEKTGKVPPDQIAAARAFINH